MSVAQINTEMAAAVALIKSGDYAGALDRAMCAQGLIAAEPDAEKGGESLRWPFDKIDKFIANLRRRAAGNLGLQRSKITYARVTE